MYAAIAAAALLVLAAVPSHAQRRSVPSICVGCSERPHAARQQRRGREPERASRPRRATTAQRRPVVPLSGGSAAESQLGSINRSLQQQQENTRASQQLQFELNQMRDIRPPVSGGALGCPVGSIGC